MGLFGRLGTVVRANVDDLVNRSEDPEKMLNQALHELSYQLVEIRKKVIVAVADERRFRAQWEAEVERARHWKQRAMLAVRHGDDGLAKEALLRRKEHEALAEEFQRQWEGQRRGVDQLKAALHQLDRQLGEAKRKRGLLLAKQHRAQAQQAIQQTLAGLSETSALETLRRVEQRIEQLEVEAEALTEMNGELTGDSLRQRFYELEAGEVDLDLLELKEAMGLLPLSTPSAVEIERRAQQLEAHRPRTEQASRPRIEQAQELEVERIGARAAFASR